MPICLFLPKRRHFGVTRRLSSDSKSENPLGRIAGLKTNLDFSIKALEAFPASKRREVSLTLEGERHLVRITARTPVLSNMAHLGTNGLQLLKRTHPESRLTTSSLTESHFAGHRCHDELERCFEQKALTDKRPSVLDYMELKITCGELHLTYSTHQPLDTLHIQPSFRVFLGREDPTKTHLEKSGEMRKDLLTCFQQLLQHYDQHQEKDARIILRVMERCWSLSLAEQITIQLSTSSSPMPRTKLTASGWRAWVVGVWLGIMEQLLSSLLQRRTPDILGYLSCYWRKQN